MLSISLTTTTPRYTCITGAHIYLFSIERTFSLNFSFASEDLLEFEQLLWCVGNDDKQVREFLRFRSKTDFVK